MIRLVFFDLGETLVHDSVLLPHVITALEAIAQLQTADGEPLVSTLVSDYYLADPPDDGDQIAVRFEEYLGLLDNLGLTEWFEPVDERVTLSTHSGVMKPDRRVFELAVTRSGIQATLEQCLFITENRKHIDAVRDLGVTALHFNRDHATKADFHDWSEGPLLIRQRVAPDSEAGLAAALSARLASAESVEITSIRGGKDRGQFQANGRKWFPLDDPELGPARGTWVQVPVNASVTLDQLGQVVDFQTGEPDPDALAEVRQYLLSLLRRGQVALSPDSVAPGQTHEITTEANGRRCLIRKRYSR